MEHSWVKRIYISPNGITKKNVEGTCFLHPSSRFNFILGIDIKELKVSTRYTLEAGGGGFWFKKKPKKKIS